MAEMSRRKFLQHGSLGVAAAAALASVPNVARTALGSGSARSGAASTAGAAGTAGAARDAELATTGPVMVHLANAKTGEIHLYVGERELTRHDPALAAAIARAARA